MLGKLHGEKEVQLRVTSVGIDDVLQGTLPLRRCVSSTLVNALRARSRVYIKRSCWSLFSKRSYVVRLRTPLYRAKIYLYGVCALCGKVNTIRVSHGTSDKFWRDMPGVCLTVPPVTVLGSSCDHDIFHFIHFVA